MKTLKSFTFALLALLAAASVTFAQGTKLKVAYDSSSGTYAKMFGEIVAVCPELDNYVTATEGQSGGSVGNLAALVENRAQLAFLHSDVFFSSSNADPMYNKFASLVTLFPEPVHVIALRQSKSTKQVETKTFGGLRTTVTQVPVEFNSLADIGAPFKVAGAGGGAVTVRVIRYSSNATFEPTELGKDELLPALESGTVAAIVFVGASPLDKVSKLDKAKFKVIPIGDALASQLTRVYREVRINYQGLTPGPIKTLAPLAVIMTRRYNTADKTTAQRRFRECLVKQLDALKDDHHPAWQDVEANDRGLASIPYLDLAAAAPKK